MRSIIISVRLICCDVVNLLTDFCNMSHISFYCLSKLSDDCTAFTSYSATVHTLNLLFFFFFFFDLIQLPGGERDSPHKSQEGKDGEKEAGAKESLQSGGSSACDGAAEQVPEQTSPAEVEQLFLFF